MSPPLMNIYLQLHNICIYSSTFLKYIDGPFSLHFVTHLILKFCQMYMNGPCDMHFVTHLVSKRCGHALQNANHRDHPCTFGKSWALIRYKVETIWTIHIHLKH
ncbi:hypothetical protein Hanom_Chr12g01072681 [Helianthus anomalus]